MPAATLLSAATPAGFRRFALLLLPLLLTVSAQAQRSPFAAPIEALAADTQYRNADGTSTDAVRCGAPTFTAAQLAAVEAETEQTRAAAGGTFGARGTTVIPVAFHVVRSGNGVSQGNVSQAMIDDQIDVLNSAYAGTNFRFSLGVVTRTTNSAWFNDCSSNENAMKAALNVSPATTLNFYSCTPGPFLGFAYLPFSFPESDFRHGVVVLHSSLPGGSAFPYNLGDTGTHEVGHYLGLYHTFREEGTCGGSGDFVSDTPAERDPAYGCPIGRNTCSGGGPDPIRNFMDYTDDSCMFEFTGGQSARMDAQVATYKPTLLQNTGGGSGEGSVTASIVNGSVVGGSGGTVTGDFTLSNTGTGTFTGEWWVQVELPNGSDGPRIGPFDLTLNSGQSTTERISRGVPGGIRSGIYVVRAFIGPAFPNDVDDSDFFSFIKTSNLTDGDGSPPARGGLTWTEEDGAAPDAAAARAPGSLAIYPSPFSDRTTVRFALGEAAEVRVAVYDVLGRRVALLAEGLAEAGEHEATFEAADLPSGVYLVRFEAAGRTHTQQITLMQ